MSPGRYSLTTISPHDTMYEGDRDHYFSVGHSAMQNILSALQLAGVKSPGRILDLPSGHGRVLRALRAEFPESEITACDLDLDGIGFCAECFGARAVPGHPDCSRIALSGEYDLIWCGSLLTHLDISGIIGFLQLFDKYLANRGVLVFTTHGRRAIELSRIGAEYLGPERHQDFEEMIQGYYQKGFAYRDYSHQPGYGISLSKPAWVVAQLEAFPQLGLLLCRESGWDNHQDVFACVKQSL